MVAVGRGAGVVSGGPERECEVAANEAMECRSPCIDEVEQFRSQRCCGARRRLPAGVAVQDADAFGAR